MTKPIFDIENIRSVFQRTTAVLHTIIPNRRSTAVALIFCAIEGELSLCFGLRAKFEGDPWSGDMAFPGGKEEPQDKTFHDIAVRETYEEIGLMLGRANLIGSLDAMETFGNAKRPSLLLRPMIYALEEKPRPFQISDELDAAFWIPIHHLWDNKNWKPNYVEWRNKQFPGIQFGRQVIWGLTLRILIAFGEEMAAPLHTTTDSSRE